MQICVLDGEKIKNPEMLHETISDALRFPEWYGANLDALFDCLTDVQEETQIRVIHGAALEEHLGQYARKVMKALRMAAEENARIRVEMEGEVPVTDTRAV